VEEVAGDDRGADAERRHGFGGRHGGPGSRNESGADSW
jgi:hypothetical protein